MRSFWVLAVARVALVVLTATLMLPTSWHKIISDQRMAHAHDSHHGEFNDHDTENERQADAHDHEHRHSPSDPLHSHQHRHGLDLNSSVVKISFIPSLQLFIPVVARFHRIIGSQNSHSQEFLQEIFRPPIV